MEINNLDKHRADKYKTKYLNSKPTDKSYPIITPYNTDYLDVGDNHKIYYEQSGKNDGIPCLFLHGGPGSGLINKYISFFNTDKIRVIGFDQRGCGRSVPIASIEHNTTWDLIKDIEKLREHLKIDKWFVIGGSWGSTLTLVYAINYPEKVLGMSISGVCLLRQTEIDWLYKKGGASNMNPEFWEEFENFIPENERNNLVDAYYKRLCSDNSNIKMKAADIWQRWEASMVSFKEPYIKDNNREVNNKILAVSILECHYFKNKAFFPNDNYILDNISKINNIPLYIVQGKYDIICPVESAYKLNKALPKSKLTIVTLCGHDRYEIPGKNHVIDSINEMTKLSTI
jgi:proline iminopeptidase